MGDRRYWVYTGGHTEKVKKGGEIWCRDCQIPEI